MINTGEFTFPGGKRKALVMSFDDGVVQDRRLVSLFNRHKIRGTFHLNSGKFGRENHITASEVKDLYSGHEVSIHTVDHPDLTDLDTDAIRSQVSEDRTALEALVGYPIRGMSYPFGNSNNTVLKVLSDLGIACSRTVCNTGTLNTIPDNPLLWHPTCHHSEAMRFAQQIVNGSRRETALLFIWGHSYELDAGTRNSSWEYMDQVCRLLGDRDDIWYTTAIEVADYIQTLRYL